MQGFEGDLYDVEEGRMVFATLLSDGQLQQGVSANPSAHIRTSIEDMGDTRVKIRACLYANFISLQNPIPVELGPGSRCRERVVRIGEAGDFSLRFAPAGIPIHVRGLLLADGRLQATVPYIGTFWLERCLGTKCACTASECPRLSEPDSDPDSYSYSDSDLDSDPDLDTGSGL